MCSLYKLKSALLGSVYIIVRIIVLDNQMNLMRAQSKNF